MTHRLCRFVGLALLWTALTLSGCARFSVKTGKAVPSVSGLERGKTTRQEILDRFGPPQVLDHTRTASYGEHHLAYEERLGRGWYFMPNVPFGVPFPIFGLFMQDENANSTVFLFDESGVLVDFAAAQSPVSKRVGWAVLAWVRTEWLLK